MQYYLEESVGDLRTVLEAQILAWPQVTARRMFGCPAYLVDGRLFAFLVTEGVVLTQLRSSERKLLAEDFEIESFKVGEREIVRWTKVTLKDSQRLPRMMRFVQKSYEAALSNH